MPHLQIQRIHEIEFTLLRREWNDLLARSACDSVFLRWEWIYTWWTIFQQHKQLFIVVARHNGRLCGLAPFYIAREGPLALRTLRYCSDELSPDYMDIVADKTMEAEVMQALVNAIIEHEREWDVIALDNQRAESLLVKEPTLFKNYFRTACLSQRCPYIQIDGTFETYFRDRPLLQPFSLERKWRRLSTDKNLVHTIVQDETGVSKGLNDLFYLHQKRAHLRGVQSNILHPKVRQFHRELGVLFLKEGILNLQLLYDGFTPVSAFYAFNYRNKTLLYQSGFDPAWSSWSVGTLLLYFAVRGTFDDTNREFDFLKGTESYKSYWTDTVRDEMQLRISNNHLRGLAWRVRSNLTSALRPVKQAMLASASKVRASAY
jgi:CelD/BcsL family acetyltransferase involved in cellulose biosynthesis